MPLLGGPYETRIRHSTLLRQILSNQHLYTYETYPKSLRDTITKLPLAHPSILGCLLDFHPMFICSRVE